MVDEGEFSHQSVLLQEAVEALAIRPEGFYIDATYGRGGHTAAILDALGKDGHLMVIDRDIDAIADAKQRLGDDTRVSIVHDSFANLAAVVSGRDWPQVDGILIDLGVSSPQLDDASRGFSFMRDGPLDMRMDVSRGQSAEAFLAEVGEAELATILRTLGEERFAKRIAGAIIRARDEAPIETTGQLAAVIAKASPTRERHKHPATRSFQAIRMHVNGELEALEAVLEASVDALAKGGRLVVVSFHSIEDGIVKRFMKKCFAGDKFPKGVPVRHEDCNAQFRKVSRAVKPNEAQIQANPRARSAVMRVAEKIQ